MWRMRWWWRHQQTDAKWRRCPGLQLGRAAVGPVHVLIASLPPTPTPYGTWGPPRPWRPRPTSQAAILTRLPPLRRLSLRGGPVPSERRPDRGRCERQGGYLVGYLSRRCGRWSTRCTPFRDFVSYPDLILRRWAPISPLPRCDFDLIRRAASRRRLVGSSIRPPRSASCLVSARFFSSCLWGREGEREGLGGGEPGIVLAVWCLDELDWQRLLVAERLFPCYCSVGFTTLEFVSSTACSNLVEFSCMF